MNKTVEEALQTLAAGLEQAAKAGTFGLNDSAVLAQSLQVVAKALVPEVPKEELTKKVK